MNILPGVTCCETVELLDRSGSGILQSRRLMESSGMLIMSTALLSLIRESDLYVAQ